MFPFFARGGPVPFQVSNGVSVLAIVLRFTFWVLVLGVIAWGAYELLTEWRRRSAAHPGQRSAALLELDMLYARGEVKRADYLTRRADLTGTPPPAAPAA